MSTRFWRLAMSSSVAFACIGACSLLVPTVRLADSDASLDGAAAPLGCAKGPNGRTRQGPEMVEIPVDGKQSFCIDSTEVTVAQFNQFVLDGGTLVGAPSPCESDAGVPLPLVESDPAQQTLPMRRVTLCHAWAYCNWAGKRLCGAIGTGGSVLNGFGDPRVSEWSFACVNGKQDTLYPYGTTRDPQACSTAGAPLDTPKSRPKCHGTSAPFDRIYDMVGNVAEFQNDFEPDANPDLGNAHLAGGSNKSTDPDCKQFDGHNGLTFAFDTDGIRCCADRLP